MFSANSSTGNAFFAGCAKILIAHFQIMPLLKKINFSWEQYLFTFLNVQAYCGNSSEAVNSIDCLFNSIYIDHLRIFINFNFKEKDFQGSTYIKTQIFTFLPFILFFWIYFYWMFKKKSYIKAVPFMIISALVTIDFLHPSIINSMIDSLSCVLIDDTFLLKTDYFYECYNSDHMKNVNFNLSIILKKKL